jgi:hypothetical protein
MKRTLLGIACVVVQVACALPAAAPPTATAVLVVAAPVTATTAPSLTPTNSPTTTMTPLKPTSTRTLVPATRRPTARPSTTTSSPSPVPGPAQACANLSARGMSGIFVVDIQPEPALVWDGRPHQFRVGVCNTIPSSTPQGRYRIFLYFPTSSQGHEESVPTPADLKSGMNTVVVGPWVPGLENHRARCATKATAEVEVGYNDLPDPIYRPLPWPDGKTRTYLPVQCGGDFA